MSDETEEKLEKLLTVKEAAKLLSISERWLYQAQTEGKVPALRFGRSIRFDPVALRAWLKSQTVTPAVPATFVQPEGA